MGKVLKVVAVVAVAAAIAYFAPQISAAILASVTTGTVSAAATAAVTAAVAASLAIGASLAFSVLAGGPHTSTAPGRQPSRAQPIEQRGLTRHYPPDPSEPTMQPVDEPWWRNAEFMPWQRYAVVPIRGRCMVPLIPKGARWVVLDRYNAIRAGDVFLMRPDDLAAYMRGSGGDRRATGLVKRFLGVDPVRRVAVYETTNPPTRIETGLDRIVHAYRVDSWHRGYVGAVLAARAKASRCS